MKSPKLAAALLVGLVAGAGLGFGLSEAGHAAGPYRGTADDFMQISQLYARYNFAIDNQDGVTWASTFTPDGEFQDPDWCVKGTDGLIKIIGTKIDVGHDLISFHDPHLGPIVYQDRDHATVRSPLATIRQKGPGKEDGGVGVTGTYADRMVRVNGQWLFAHRTVYRLSPHPWIQCALKP